MEKYLRAVMPLALQLACSGGGGETSTGSTTVESPSTGATSGVTDTATSKGSTSTGSTATTGESGETGGFSTSDGSDGTSAPETSGSGTTGPCTSGCETSGTGGVDPCEGHIGCGDGERDYVCEECDLGPDLRDDGPCTTTCRAAFCGDGLVHAGVERCDDGDADPDDECPNDCGNSFTYTPPRLVAGAYHMCALSEAGKVRCWGGSTWKHGQLGYGSTQQVGNDPGEMPPPDVDVGGKVVQITAGEVHTCALLDGGAVRCWGDGSTGALGYGSAENVGDEPGEMPPPDVDVGGEVVQIAAGEFNTCALLASGKVRCWGAHSQQNIGDDPGEMPPPDIAVDGTFVQIHGNRDQSCVLRENGTAACWGTDHAPYGVFFGGFVVELSGEVCGRLAGGAIRCEGYNDDGQKGYGHNQYIGDAMKAGDIPVGGAVTRLVPDDYHTCAILEGGAVRCWGANSGGALGYGHTSDLGDQPGEMPTPNVALGGPAVELALTPSYTCAVLVGGVVRCWGNGKTGDLGYGNYQSIGDQPGEMPPPAVPVF